MTEKEKYIPHSFKEILDTIAPNYTWGFSALILPIMLLGLPKVFFSSEPQLGDKFAFLSMFVLMPLALFLQSLSITFICFLGSKVRLFVHLKLHSNQKNQPD